MGPADLRQVLDGLPHVKDSRVLVARETFDDAGVIQLSEDLALVQSVDFFTPIVDDPFDYGRIAAANALSDIYAMGGKPLSALSVCAFPPGLDLNILHHTLAGGLVTLREDGVVPLGGHTVKSPEFHYGLSVTGTVHPNRLLTNAGALPEDVLVLTKPLGTGVMATALKQERLDLKHTARMIETMARTNRHAAEALGSVDTHALTDVTGYGLLNHALEMAQASSVSLEIHAQALPLLEGAIEAAAAGSDFGGLIANRGWAQTNSNIANLDKLTSDILCDPQTSGGLLAAIAAGDVAPLQDRCAAHNEIAVVIGHVLDGKPGTANIVGRVAAKHVQA